MRIFTQLAIALGVAAIVFAIVIVAAWVGLGPEPMIYRRQWTAQIQIQRFASLLNQDLDKYMQENRKVPDRVTNLPFFSTDDLPFYLERNANGDFLDVWKNTLQYLTEGDKVVVMSYGRDGAPGGIGPDADLYSDGRNRAAKYPSLRQFLTERDNNEIAIVGFYLDAILTAGIVACSIFLKLLAQSKSREKVKLRDTIKNIFIFVAVSVGVGIILLMFHIPNGH